MDVLEKKNYIPPTAPYQFTFTSTSSIIAIYLMFVYLVGPRWMKSRPAFKLNNFLRFYNIAQVVTCLYITNYIWSLTSWEIFNFKKCVAYLPNTPERRLYDDIANKITLLKIFELTDTIIFVLRKKQSQITYLHVFHHAATVSLCYVGFTHYKGIGYLFTLYLNSWVHVVMYSYYFFANICSPETIRKYILIKKSITIMQMVQFTIILINACCMWKLCDLHLIIKIYYCVVVSVIFYGFYDFYKKAYTNKQENKSQKNKTT